VIKRCRYSSAALVLAGILLTIPVAAIPSDPKLEARIPVNEVVRSTAISPDGKIAGVLKGNKIGIWSIADAHQFQLLEFGVAQAVFCDFLDNGTHLLVGFSNGNIRLHDVQTGKVLRSLDNGAPPQVVRVSRDGKWLAAAGGDREVHLWDLATGKMVHRLALELGEAMDLAFSPDGKMLAGSSEDTNIYVWDTNTGAVKNVVRDLSLTTFGLAFVPDGKWLFAGGGDYALHVIDAGSGKVARNFPAQKMPVIALAMAPDGKSIVAVYRDANEPFGSTPILLWSTESGELLKKNDSPELKANGGGFLSDGRLVYSTMNGKELQVWSLR
jgi:WD40 repeat protein